MSNASVIANNRVWHHCNTAEPDVWSFWDFFYFSTIIQTTVGLGDILPNSTLVRMIVTTQVLIGYALLIVVLNIVLTNTSS